MNRLKFDLKTHPPVAERADKEPCGICRRQISRYTCPTCNIPYCSLTCFRSEAHSNCSETFYRREIEKDIKSNPKKSAGEKNTMLELLRKFEEENVEETDVLTQGGGDLAQKLEEMNLDEADSDEIWSVLSPSQREKFFKAIRDPSSELAQQLLSSTELQKEQRKPWWESPLLEGDETSAENGIDITFGGPPKMMSIPRTLTSPKTASESNRFLVYNILTLCLAYAYVTRRISSSPLSALKVTDPDHIVARDLLSHISPFLIDRKSTLLFNCVDDVATYVWSKLEALSDTPSADSFSVLLSDAATLFQPPAVAVISDNDTGSPAPQSALLAISDIFALFSPAKVNHVLHKLNFYAAHLLTQNADILRLVAEETRIVRLKMQSQPYD